MSEEYLKWHNESGIKVGDKVRVLRQARPKELGWYMQDVSPCYSINGILKVREDQRERGFVLDDGRFYPYFILEVVELKEERTYKIGDRFRGLYAKWYMLAAVDTCKMLLIADDGKRWGSGAYVEDTDFITKKEFSEICQGDEGIFELIEEE